MDNFSLCTTNPLTVIADRFILGQQKTFYVKRAYFASYVTLLAQVYGKIVL